MVIDLAVMAAAGYGIIKLKITNSIKALLFVFPLLYLNEMMAIGLYFAIGYPGLVVVTLIMIGLLVGYFGAISRFKIKWNLSWHYRFLMFPVTLLWLFNTMRWFMSG